jgi:hypothetical protein
MRGLRKWLLSVVTVTEILPCQQMAQAHAGLHDTENTESLPRFVTLYSEYIISVSCHGRRPARMPVHAGVAPINVSSGPGGTKLA